MASCKSVFAVLKGSFGKWKRDDRVWLVFILTAVLLCVYMIRLPIYGKEIGGTITPFMLPFIFTEQINGNGNLKVLIFFGFILLMSDTPSLQANRHIVVIRCGRKNWWLGECIYVLCTAFIYVMYISILSSLFTLPLCTSDGSWGTLPDRIARSDSLRSSLLPGIVMPKAQISRITAAQAFIYAFSTFYLLSVFLGILILTLNLCTKSLGVGISVAAFLVLLDPVINYMMDDFSWHLYLFSPVNWSSMDLLKEFSGKGYLTGKWVYTALMLIIIIPGYISYRKIKRMDL